MSSSSTSSDVTDYVQVFTVLASLAGVLIMAYQNTAANKRQFEQQQKKDAQNAYQTHLEKINRHREPLIQSCLDIYHFLQSIFYQDQNGLGTEGKKIELMYAFGQLFFWMEIVRKELIEFDFTQGDTNLKIRSAMGDVYTAFEDGNYIQDTAFQLSYMNQRALGELMFNKKKECCGYNEFMSQLNKPIFNNWFQLIKNPIEAVELSLPRFDRTVYYRINYQKQQHHPWEDSYLHPGTCSICKETKFDITHHQDITAFFPRLYSINRAVIALATTLDFDRTRITNLQKDVQQDMPDPTKKTCWQKIKAGLIQLKASLCCKKKFEATEIVNTTSSLTGDQILVDRFRHDFIERIVSQYRQKTSDNNVHEPSEKEESLILHQLSPLQTVSIISLSSGDEKQQETYTFSVTNHSSEEANDRSSTLIDFSAIPLELVIKLRSNHRILDKKTIHMNTCDSVAMLRQKICMEFKNKFQELQWREDQIGLYSLLTCLEVGYYLGQYNLRNGTIIYVLQNGKS
jgi:hypothetical protein